MTEEMYHHNTPDTLDPGAANLESADVKKLDDVMKTTEERTARALRRAKIREANEAGARQAAHYKRDHRPSPRAYASPADQLASATPEVPAGLRSAADASNARHHRFHFFTKDGKPMTRAA
jgi:hypothetical protein